MGILVRLRWYHSTTIKAFALGGRIFLCGFLDPSFSFSLLSSPLLSPPESVRKPQLFCIFDYQTLSSHLMESRPIDSLGSAPLVGISGGILLDQLFFYRYNNKTGYEGLFKGRSEVDKTFLAGVVSVLSIVCVSSFRLLYIIFRRAFKNSNREPRIIPGRALFSFDGFIGHNNNNVMVDGCVTRSHNKKGCNVSYTTTITSWQGSTPK
jgi:hypothetical protein